MHRLGACVYRVGEWVLAGICLVTLDSGQAGRKDKLISYKYETDT